MQRVPAERRAIMERHIAHLTETGIGQNAKQVGDLAPAIVLPDAQGKPFELATLLAKRPRHRDVLSRRMVPLLQSGAQGLSGRAAADHRGRRQPCRHQPREAGRLHEYNRKECFDISSPE